MAELGPADRYDCNANRRAPPPSSSSAVSSTSAAVAPVAQESGGSNIRRQHVTAASNGLHHQAAPHAANQTRFGFKGPVARGLPSRASSSSSVVPPTSLKDRATSSSVAAAEAGTVVAAAVPPEINKTSASSASSSSSSAVVMGNCSSASSGIDRSVYQQLAKPVDQDAAAKRRSGSLGRDAASKRSKDVHAAGGPGGVGSASVCRQASASAGAAPAGSASLRRPIFKWNSTKSREPAPDEHKAAAERQKQLGASVDQGGGVVAVNGVGGSDVGGDSVDGPGGCMTVPGATTTSVVPSIGRGRPTQMPSARPNGPATGVGGRGMKVLVNFRTSKDNSSATRLQSAYGHRDLFGNGTARPETVVLNGNEKPEVVDELAAGDVVSAAGGDVGDKATPCGGSENMADRGSGLCRRLSAGDAEFHCDATTAGSSVLVVRSAGDAGTAAGPSVDPPHRAARQTSVASSPPPRVYGASSAAAAAAGGDACADDEVLLDAVVHRHLMTELYGCRLQLAQLQQLLERDSSLAVLEEPKPPAECSHCMRHLSAIGTLQQENTQLQGQLSAMKDLLNEKNNIIEELRQQLACASSTVSSELLPTNMESQRHQYSDTEQQINGCDTNANVNSGIDVTSSANGRPTHTAESPVSNYLENVFTAPQSPGGDTVLRDKRLLSRTSSSRRRSSSDDADEIFENRRRTLVSRQMSDDSADCFESIFDYHSQHQSVDLDEGVSECGDVDSLLGEDLLSAKAIEKREMLFIRRDSKNDEVATKEPTQSPAGMNGCCIELNGLTRIDEASNGDSQESGPEEMAEDKPQTLMTQTSAPVGTTSTTTRAVSRLPGPKTNMQRPAASQLAKRQTLVNGLVTSSTVGIGNDVKSTKLVPTTRLQ